MEAGIKHVPRLLVNLLGMTNLPPSLGDANKRNPLVIPQEWTQEAPTFYDESVTEEERIERTRTFLKKEIGMALPREGLPTRMEVVLHKLRDEECLMNKYQYKIGRAKGPAISEHDTATDIRKIIREKLGLEKGAPIPSCRKIIEKLCTHSPDDM